MNNDENLNNLEGKLQRLQQISDEAEVLLDSEMEDATGGCWQCDKYCKQCVSGGS